MVLTFVSMFVELAILRGKEFWKGSTFSHDYFEKGSCGQRNQPSSAALHEVVILMSLTTCLFVERTA